MDAKRFPQKVKGISKEQGFKGRQKDFQER
jgi:hypothetical protein